MLAKELKLKKKLNSAISVAWTMILHKKPIAGVKPKVKPTCFFFLYSLFIFIAF